MPTATSAKKTKAPGAIGKHLLIVESPHKAQTIGKFLGKDYIVLSSKGHIRDLPEKGDGIDIEHDFTPKYEVSKKSLSIVKELRAAAKDATDILLASDPDREGEAIAWHLREILSSAAKGKNFYRIQYNEITPRAVRAALEHPGDINQPRVDAQQARRVIDRIVGYKVSPFVWRNVKGGNAAGRVQSVALRLVCEREAEINAFVPVSYWIIGAMLQKPGYAPFFARLSRVNGEKAEINSSEQAEHILTDLQQRSFLVDEIQNREISKRALPPFITSSLQRAASSVLGLTPGRTMSIAQKLYEGVNIGGSEGHVGLITYMRTDAPAVSLDAQKATRDFINENYGTSFYPEKPNAYRSSEKAQEAHEAIRPTDVNRTPASLAHVLEPVELKLYDLIWRRFVASQMAPARFAQRTVLFNASSNLPNADQYTFSASATDTLFEGFMKVMKLDVKKLIAMPDGRDTETQQEEADASEEGVLPALSIHEKVDLSEIKSTQKETKPPPRYSEASLIEALEKNGIGRPSTYATIMESIIKHNYVTRENKALAPTDIGNQVKDVLVTKLPALFNVGFTAEMETDLDRIETGDVTYLSMMQSFYAKFTEWMKDAKGPPANSSVVQSALNLLNNVTEWLQVEKRGRRKYDDQKFVLDIQDQFSKGDRPISEKQLEALGKMIWRYRSQIQDAESKLKEIGLENCISDSLSTPAISLEKLDVILSYPSLSEVDRRKYESFHRQSKSGRNLSEKQIASIDFMFKHILPSLPNNEELSQRFSVKLDPPSTEKDEQSPILIEALSQVKEWIPPTKKGRFSFDDCEFFHSIQTQFESKGSLSYKQRNAIRKMIGRYKSQIPNADEILSEIPHLKKPNE